MSITLHSYWRSGAAWRLRIALALKGLDHAQVTHDLRKGVQRGTSYLALNPQGLVPALEVDRACITQSLAIMEWLDESYPQPALLPVGALDRAMVRSMAQLIACDIHPLNNLRVLSRLRGELNASEAEVSDWIATWVTEGFTALENLIRRHGGLYAFGHSPTMADCCLVPQVYSARRFGVHLTPFPAILAVDANCSALASFQNAVPTAQADAD